ncbi:MAG TPA: diacylglycerol kinase family protein [Polyangia bacterium]|nr:diacylglycerol kinase family protein [Polyangia bacterium]
MDLDRPLVIINPRSGRGLTEARWARLRPELTDGLGELDSAFTTGPRDAAAIARREAEAGRRLIIAMGGDGTVSEVADGILSAGAGARTELGMIPRGTGGDFRRTLELPHDIAEAGRRIRAGTARAIDAGRVTYRGHDGQTETRHFVNVASFGFSSAVARRANSSSKRLGGRIAFLTATVGTLFSYDNTDVWISVDGGAPERRRVLLAALGNGRFFGGGMKICPEAALDDGVFDLITVGDFSRTEVLTNVGRLFSGTHLELEEVQSTRVRRLQAEPVEPDAQIPVELDGETPGHLPATFEILPQALRVRL